MSQYQIVLGELLNQAEPVAKRVISAYNADTIHLVNLKNMLKYDANQLEACAKYLGFIVRDEDEKKRYSNKQMLCDRVILKIESLFDTHCDECDQTYRNTLTDEPHFTCRVCMQGSHNCENFLKKKEACDEMPKDNKPVGAVWLCHECLKKNDLRLAPAPTKAKILDNSKTEIPVEQETTERAEYVAEEDGDENTVYKYDRESPRRGRYTENSSSNSNVCELYKSRKCPHGLTGKRLIRGERCPKNHPPRCHRYCRHGEDPKMGCKFGPECRYYHPKLCRQSVLRRVCLNPDCTYNHLKFTRRSDNPRPDDYPRPEQPQRPERGFLLSRSQRNERENHWQHREFDANNRPAPRARFDSIGSAYNTYTTTLDTRQPRTRKDSVTQRDNSFLERLMENLKEGIISQMNDKISQLRTEIPSLILESNQWDNPSQPPRQQVPLQLSSQHPVQQMSTQIPTTFHYNPANFYPGSSY